MTIMRKYILLLCALCAGLVSCVKEDFVGAEADGLVTFKASYEPQTKTVINGLTPYFILFIYLISVIIFSDSFKCVS